MSARSSKPQRPPDPGRAPRVSIGLPVFNAEDHLASSLDALLSQSFTDFELLISDNGSTDASETICRRYARADRRIRYERQPVNRGLHWNCNRVCELARGEFFKWAAVDDRHAPSFLARCVDALDADPGLINCHCKSDYIGSDGERFYDNQLAGDAKLGTSNSSHRRFRDVLLTHGWGTRCFGLTRREPLQRTGLLAEPYGWQKVMMAELALAGRFALVDEVLFFERSHPVIASQRSASSDSSDKFSGESKKPRTGTTIIDRNGRGLAYMQFLKGYLSVAWRRSPDFYTLAWTHFWMFAYVFQVRKWLRLGAGWISRRWAALVNHSRPTPNAVKAAQREVGT